MEYLTYEGNNQQKIERFLLGVYTIYYLNMVVKSVKLDWSSWIGILLTAIYALCCMIHVGKVKNYKFRAFFSAVMMQVSLLIYAFQLEDIQVMLPIFVAFVVFFGLYGFPEIINTTYFIVVILFLYHGFVAKTLSLNTWEEQLLLVVQIGNIFVVEYVVYVWTKRNSEGSRQLLAVIDELKAVENRKDDFIANVSHEIRTPINTICGMSEIVLKEDLPKKVKEDVQGILLAGRNLMSVVRDILDFSELQTGNIELEEEAYNIASTINDIINMTVARKNKKKLELIVDCDANIPSVLLGDEKKIRRVIMNLVDNAIKFTEQGGVSITVGFRKESYGINLLIMVKDTGIGIDAESLEKLFDAFNQVDGSTRRQEGGLGLGLPISSVLAKKLGATLTIKSKVGKGTTVKFVVPQKVLDETPIATMNDRKNVKVATYIDMEQFALVEIRDEYSKMIVHMVEQLRGNCHVCRNFQELQRRYEKEFFTHIFISIVEYKEKKEYFDDLSEKTNVIIVLDQCDEKYITSPFIQKIYKPFYILAIASVLNNDGWGKTPERRIQMEKFTTREAHVLIVDDNRMNLRVMEGLLRMYDIKTTTAMSGQEALEKITTCDYDFVFMDHMMPEMDGVETMHRIRHKVGTYYQNVPIVALTANAVAGSREALLQEGFDDFLEKPVERSVLERVLRRTLPAEKILPIEAVSEDMDEEVAVSGEIQKETVVSEEIQKDNIVSEDVRKENILSEDVQKENVKDSELTDAEMEDALKKCGMDVEKAILYCSGWDGYLEILKDYCENYKETEESAVQAFRERDWENYTIYVHGMKSSLRCVGATGISKMAEELEHAGKRDDVAFIEKNHEAFLEKYESLFRCLCEFSWLREDKENQQPVEEAGTMDLPVLEQEHFEAMLAEMEDAAYMQEIEVLTARMEELQGFQYQGEALKELLEPVQKKMEKADYISAVELIARIAQRLSKKEG